MIISTFENMGQNFLYLPEYSNLSQCETKYRQEKSIDNLMQYYDAFHRFLEFNIAYAADVLSKIHISQEESILAIFTDSASNDKLALAHLNAMKTYAEFLNKTVDSIEMMKYADDVVLTMLVDCEELLRYTEYTFNDIETYGCYGGRKGESPRDIFWAINQLFSLPQSISKDYIDIRNVQPITTFLIRQFIETSINYAIGIASIENQGKPASGHISKTINFFCDSSLHKGFSIQQPLDKDCILAIYTWSNIYVHTGLQSAYYVMFYAWDYISTLIAPPEDKKQVLIYTGKYRQSSIHGDIRIEHYHILRQEYEQFISPKGKFTINWLPEENVGAYILSL